MEKNSVESSLKRFLKRKVKITLGVIVSFMIMGTVEYAEEIVVDPIIIDELNKPSGESGNEKEKKVEIIEEKDIKFNSSDKINDYSEFTIHIDNGNQNGYGDNKKFGYVNIDTKGNFIIKGTKDNIVKGGINVNTYAGTIDINADKGIVIDIKGDTLIGATESGHINLKAKEKIILNAESNNNFIVMGYIGNLNNSYSTVGKKNENLVGINGIRESDINIETDGDIILTAEEKNENNLMNVGIFSAGVRKKYNPVINKDDKTNDKYIDKDGYVMSEKNVTMLNGNNIDITIKNKHGIANGILVQDSDKAFVNLNSINDSSLIVTAEHSDSIGIDTADGNIKLSSSNGSNTIKAITKNSENVGIGIQTENNKDNWNNSDYFNRIDLIAEKNNIVFGTSTGIYSIGKDTIINIKNNNGINKISSERGTTIEVVDSSKTNLVSTNGNNYIEREKNLDENNVIKIETGGELLLSAGGTNTVIGDISVKNENSLLKVETSKNQFVGNILAEDKGQVTANFNGEISLLTGAISIGENNDGIVNIGVTNNGRWNNTNHSSVTNLELNNGIIDLAYTNDNQDISIKNITGENGTFIMDVSTEDLNHTERKTDFINIENANKTQTHFVQIGENSINGLANYDFGNKNPDKAIWIADADENITFEGKKFESVKNVFDYTLELDSNLENNNTSANGNNWYVTGVKKSDSDVTNMIEDNLSYLYNAGLSRLELDTLHKRMGEIKNYENAYGVWFRTSAGKMKSDVSDSSFKNDYYMLQVGYDTKTVEENGDYFTGLAVSRRESDIDYSNGNGDGEDIGVALYRSYAKNDGTYIDLVGRYTYIDTEYNVNSMKADYDTWAGGLSLEYGKKYRDKSEKWYVIPHAQLSYTYIDGADYKTSSGVKVEQDDIDSLIGRVGIYAGKDFEKSSHYIKASFLHEFMGDYGANITGADARIHRDLSGADSWAEVGIGGNFKVGKSGTTHIYYDIERTLGSDFETQWQGTLGIRISF